jgi:hypothetical protein
MVMVMKLDQAGAAAAAAKAVATGEWSVAHVVCGAVLSVSHNTSGALPLHQLDPPLARSRPLRHKRQQQQQQQQQRQQQQQAVLISRRSVVRSSHRLTNPPRAHHRPIPVRVSVVWRLHPRHGCMFLRESHLRLLYRRCQPHVVSAHVVSPRLRHSDPSQSVLLPLTISPFSKLITCFQVQTISPPLNSSHVPTTLADPSTLVLAGSNLSNRCESRSSDCL